MNNTNIVVSLDTRRPKKDGSYPLILRVGHNERTTSIPLGISIHEKDWDAKTRTVKKSYTGTTTVTRLNNLIQKMKADATDVILKLHESGQAQLLSVKAIKDRIARQNASPSFTGYATKLIEELIKANRIGTARSYKGVISVLTTFNKGKDVFFKDITYSFLTKFDTYHKANGNTANGLAVYMRTIRSIFNKAIKEGIIEKELYPFQDYKIKTIPTEKRALEWDLLKKLIMLDLPQSHICFNARNYFLASYMMYGMNFTDMASLKKKDISNGRLVYRRKKTNKLYDIKITENLKSILSYYLNLNTQSEYIFPIIKRNTSILQDKDIQWARKRYNKKLKVLANLCSIEKNLTSYVSRHSFATQAMLQEVPLNAISTMMGHSSIKTTEIYIKGLPNTILDEYNSKIISL